MDGGHTLRVLLENRDELDEGKQYVKLEILTGVEGIFEDLAAARNTSTQVQDKSIANLRDYFSLWPIACGQAMKRLIDAIGVSKMYLRYVDKNAKAVTFEEAFYMATKGGGEFFGKVGSFEEGYEFDALVLDDSILAHPLELNLRQRLERSIYLSLDLCGGIKEKYIQGNKII